MLSFHCPLHVNNLQIPRHDVPLKVTVYEKPGNAGDFKLMLKASQQYNFSATGKFFPLW